MKLLHQKGIEGEASDGMDVALFIIDEGNKCFKFAGANNPAYFINNHGLEILKADRMPIGIHINFTTPFTTCSIPYNPGDMIYLFSDGYADQFGGPDNKKFRYKQFQDLLSSIHHTPLSDRNAVFSSRCCYSLPYLFSYRVIYCKLRINQCLLK